MDTALILTRYEFVVNTAFASQYVLGVNTYSAGNLRPAKIYPPFLA
jgi:hypothetical protein